MSDNFEGRESLPVADDFDLPSAGNLYTHSDFAPIVLAIGDSIVFTIHLQIL